MNEAIEALDDLLSAAITAGNYSAHPQPAAAHTCNWPDCGHDTNRVGHSPGCTGKFCKPAQDGGA